MIFSSKFLIFSQPDDEDNHRVDDYEYDEEDFEADDDIPREEDEDFESDDDYNPVKVQSEILNRCKGYGP